MGSFGRYRLRAPREVRALRMTVVYLPSWPSVQYARRPVTVSPKQIVGILLVIAGGVAGVALLKDSGQVIAISIAVVAAIAIFVGGQGGGAGGGGPSIEGLAEAARRAAAGERVSAPASATGELARVYDELAALADRRKREATEVATRKADVDQYERTLEEAAKRLSDGVGTQLGAADETSRLIKELTGAIRDIAQHVEALASSAEESSSSILEMTATNDEVAENIGELAGSVRETVSSIEEMAYSIKEVAKNVDALSLTAEETSARR